MTNVNVLPKPHSFWNSYIPTFHYYFHNNLDEFFWKYQNVHIGELFLLARTSKVSLRLRYIIQFISFTFDHPVWIFLLVTFWCIYVTYPMSPGPWFPMYLFPSSISIFIVPSPFPIFVLLSHFLCPSDPCPVCLVSKPLFFLLSCAGVTLGCYPLVSPDLSPVV